MLQSKCKVLFIGPFPPPHSGPEYSAKMFIESNIKDFFKLISINSNFRTNNKDKGKFDFSMIKAFFMINAKLMRKLFCFRPQIVYFYATATILGWLGKDIWIILLSKLFRAKVIVHFRAGHFRNNYNNTNIFFRFIVKYFLNATTLILVQSKSLVEHFFGIVDLNKVDYIHNMINLDVFKNPNPLSYDKNLIFFLGHLSYAKGYCDILSIIPEIVKEFPQIKFVFAGSLIKEEKNIFYNQITNEKIDFVDPEIAYAELIKDKYEKNYSFLGNIGVEKKIDYMIKANFFILPSYSEGFSMSVLEAISLSKPVLTTCVGSLKDIIINDVNGILINPGDKNMLKKSILKLLKEENYRNDMSYYNQKYRLKFATSKIEKKYIKIFNEIL